MTAPARKALIVRLCLVAAFVAACLWAASRVDWRVVGEQLLAADPVSVAGIAVAWTAALAIRPLRTMVIARSIAPESRIAYSPFWTANIASLAVNTVLPMRAGDVLMAVILNRRLGTSGPAAVSIVLFDRFFEFATVIVIFATPLWVVPVTAAWTRGTAAVLIPAIVMLAAGLWLAIHLRKFWLMLFDRLFARSSSPRIGRLRGLVRDLVGGFARLDDPRTLALVVALSIGQWLGIAASWWVGLAAVWPSAGFAAAAFAAAVVALSVVVPIVPGGVGVVQGAAMLALSAFDVPAEPALALAIVIHSVQASVVLLLGALALAWEGIGLGSLLRMKGGN